MAFPPNPQGAPYQELIFRLSIFRKRRRQYIEKADKASPATGYRTRSLDPFVHVSSINETTVTSAAAVSQYEGPVGRVGEKKDLAKGVFYLSG